MNFECWIMYHVDNISIKIKASEHHDPNHHDSP